MKCLMMGGDHTSQNGVRPRITCLRYGSYLFLLCLLFGLCPVPAAHAQHAGYRTIEANAAVNLQAWPDPDLSTVPVASPRPAGDVNGDGINDWVYVYNLAADERTTDPYDRSAKTFLKFGGTFDRYYDVHCYEALDPVGDLNGDGYADALALTDDHVRFFRGGPSGYQEAGLLPASMSVLGDLAGIGDLNKDGRDDVVLFAKSTRGLVKLSVLLGASQVSAMHWVHYESALEKSRVWTQVAVGAFEDDEAAHIVVVSEEHDSALVSVEVITLSAEQRLVQAQLFAIPTITTPDAAEIANIDGTGARELLVWEWPNRWYVFEYAEDVLQEAARQASVDDHFAQPIGDLDGDGILDYLTRRLYTYGNHYSVIFGPANLGENLPVYQELNFGQDARARLAAPGSQAPARFGDLNGDGFDDYSLFVKGTDYFGPRFIFGAAAREEVSQVEDAVAFERNAYVADAVYQSVGVGDWNGDGHDDVALLYHEQFAREHLRGRAGIFYGIPAGEPDVVIMPPQEGQEFVSAAAGDFTGNGKPNLAVAWKARAGAGDAPLCDFDHKPLPAMTVYEAGHPSPVHSVRLKDLHPDPDIWDCFDEYGVTALSGVGDINGDGIDDLLVGAPFVDRVVDRFDSSVFVYFGGARMSTRPDLTIDYHQQGARKYARAGMTLARLGDVNGDDLEDFAVSVAEGLDRYSPTDVTRLWGTVYVHFGVQNFSGSQTDAEELATPDVAIRYPDEEVTEFVGRFPSSTIAAGDFNGDGYGDLAAMANVFPLREEDLVSTDPQYVHVYFGGDEMDGAVDTLLTIPTDVFEPASDSRAFSTRKAVYGELTRVPDVDGNESDELFLGSYYGLASNGLLYLGGSTIRAEAVLAAPDPEWGLGAYWHFQRNSSAVGDFDGDGSIDLVLPQYNNPVVLGSAAYTYTLDLRATRDTVEVSDLRATWEENRVVVTWTTSGAGPRFAGFDVQRRVDQNPWVTLGRVDGREASEGRYRFEDRDVPASASRLAYRLAQVYADGTTVLLPEGTDTDLPSREEPPSPDLPDQFALRPIYPSPARTRAHVPYDLPEQAAVRLEVYDLLGRRRMTLHNAEEVPGRKEFAFDVSGLASGTYFVRMQAGPFAETRRLVVLR